MSVRRFGVVLHATGRFGSTVAGWQAPGATPPFDQLATSRTLTESADDPKLVPTARTWLDRLASSTADDNGAVLRVDRVDVTWWVSGPLPNADELARWLDLDHPLPAPEPDLPGIDRWEPTIAWPQDWYPLAGTNSLQLSCTRESRAGLRLWLICSTHPHVINPNPGGLPSISALTDRLDAIDQRGRLADYVTNQARARHHLLASMETDAHLPLLHHLATPPSDALPALAEATAAQATTEQAIQVVEANLTRTRSDLVQALNHLAGQPIEWPFAISDATQAQEACATTRYNAGRAHSVERRGQALRAHADATRQEAATRANSYATLLLTVAAGSLAAAQLATETATRTGMVLVVGGALGALGLAVVDASAATTRAHAMVTGIAGAATGAGAATLGDASTIGLMMATAGGLLAGPALTVLWSWLSAGRGSGPLREWLGAPLQRRA